MARWPCWVAKSWRTKRIQRSAAEGAAAQGRFMALASMAKNLVGRILFRDASTLRRASSAILRSGGRSCGSVWGRVGYGAFSTPLKAQQVLSTRSDAYAMRGGGLPAEMARVCEEVCFSLQHPRRSWLAGPDFAGSRKKRLTGVELSSGSLSCAAALSRDDFRLCRVNAFASSLVTSSLPSGCQESWMAHLRHTIACRYDMGLARLGQSGDSKSGMQGKMKSGSSSSPQESRATFKAWLN